jgi:hypothetical protein
MDDHSVDGTSYSTQYHAAFLKYSENEYCASHRRWPIIKPESVPSIYLFPSAMGCRCGQYLFEPYDLPSDDVENSMPKNRAEMMPG